MRMSNWFKKTALNPGEVRYIASFPIEIIIDSTGDPIKDQSDAYDILTSTLGASSNIQVRQLYLSDVQLYEDVLRGASL
jgi:hypothetical protein